MLTPRGRVVLGLGFGVYIAAWAFGSKPLYPVATGLLLVVAVAWVWVRLANRPFRVTRGWGDREHLEGDDAPVVVELQAAASVLPAAATLVERVGRLGEQRHALRRSGRAGATRSRTFGSSSPIRSGSRAWRCRCRRREPCSCTRGWRGSSASSRRRARIHTTDAGCCCGVTAASSCTGCASTSRANRFAACTGGQRHDADS